MQKDGDGIEARCKNQINFLMNNIIIICVDILA